MNANGTSLDNSAVAVPTEGGGVFDSDAAASATTKMWRALGEQIAAAVPAMVIDHDDPVLAIKWATCAEACLWKATGECDTHDVKDVLPKLNEGNPQP